MPPPLTTRPRVALGLVAAAILAVPPALHLRHRRADAPDLPAAASQHAAPPGETAVAPPVRLHVATGQTTRVEIPAPSARATPGAP